MQGVGSIYFATLQGYVINETELYLTHYINNLFLPVTLIQNKKSCQFISEYRRGILITEQTSIVWFVLDLAGKPDCLFSHTNALLFDSTDKDKIFVECDEHMWLLKMKQNLPGGITFHSGFEWICLYRDFVEYAAATGTDPLLTGLKQMYKYIMAAEEVHYENLPMQYTEIFFFSKKMKSSSEIF